MTADQLQAFVCHDLPKGRLYTDNTSERNVYMYQKFSIYPFFTLK